MDMNLRNSRSWWWTGRPDVLESIGSQRVRHWTELNQYYCWGGHAYLETSKWENSVGVIDILPLYFLFRVDINNQSQQSFPLSQILLNTEFWRASVVNKIFLERQNLCFLKNTCIDFKIRKPGFWSLFCHLGKPFLTIHEVKSDAILQAVKCYLDIRCLFIFNQIGNV